MHFLSDHCAVLLAMFALLQATDMEVQSVGTPRSSNPDGDEANPLSGDHHGSSEFQSMHEVNQSEPHRNSPVIADGANITRRMHGSSFLPRLPSPAIKYSQKHGMRRIPISPATTKSPSNHAVNHSDQFMYNVSTFQSLSYTITLPKDAILRSDPSIPNIPSMNGTLSEISLIQPSHTGLKGKPGFVLLLAALLLLIGVALLGIPSILRALGGPL